MKIKEDRFIINKKQGGVFLKKVILLSSLLILGLLAGCGGKTEKTPDEKAKVNSNAVLPEIQNKSGKVMIQTVAPDDSVYPYNSYIISSSKGENIIVDPNMMPIKDIVDFKPVAIMSTHNHADHYDGTYSDSYDDKVKKFCSTVESFKTRDFNIYSVESAHDGDTIMKNPSNVIIVMEVDGLRIAHFGDCGQTKFTDEQLSKIGKIDIAFMQFQNSYSHMDLSNMKGFNLAAQINPSIVIPTHYTDDAIPVLERKFGKIQEFDNKMTISKADITSGKTIVYRISNTHRYS